jgi:mRNA interferase HigB
MRIISRKRLQLWSRMYPDAATSLEAWALRTQAAHWKSLMDVRRDFPQADGVVVKSRRVVTVFNIRGNNYRLITAIHYQPERVYLLRFYTHSDYDRSGWEDTL